MLCSNCKIIEVCLKPNESATCENGHYLCLNCMSRMSDKCLLCDGRVVNNEEETWVCLQPNWTPEMIREWSRQSDFGNNEETESITDGYYDRSEDCDTASMNLLYSKGEAYEADSLQQSDSANISDSKWLQPIKWSDVFRKGPDQFSKSSSSPNKPKPMCQQIGYKDERPALVRKDTRQTLLEKKKEEIREKIMDEIFNSFKDDPRPNFKQDGYAYIKQFQTVGVSTESTPRLLPEESLHSSRSPEHSHDSVPKGTTTEQAQFIPHPREFLVMNVDTTGMFTNPKIAEAYRKKKSVSSIDFKIQQIMGKILESVADTPNDAAEDQHFYKFIRERFSHMPLAKLEEIISSIHNESDNSNIPQVGLPCQTELLTRKPTEAPILSNSRRAYYNPPRVNQPETTPNPQFQIITFSNLKASSELSQTEIIDAATLNIPRSPVICPISTCQRAFFVSDFTKHIAVDHSKVPIERIFPCQCKNFFLDPKLIHFGVSRCQVLLLVRDKIMNLGHEKFKDFIPVLVMTTKINLLELCSSTYRLNSDEVPTSAPNFIMIWLTGIMPPQLPIFFSLTVWARSGYMPTCHMVHSGRLYSVRNSQSPDAIRNSGQMLMLSENQVDLLTNRGRQMLELQIAVH